MHRDLKPENFLYANKKESSPLKAIDFGLSVFFRPGMLCYELILEHLNEIMEFVVSTNKKVKYTFNCRLYCASFPENLSHIRFHS